MLLGKKRVIKCHRKKKSTPEIVRLVCLSAADNSCLNTTFSHSGALSFNMATPMPNRILTTLLHATFLRSLWVLRCPETGRAEVYLPGCFWPADILSSSVKKMARSNHVIPLPALFSSRATSKRPMSWQRCGKDLGLVSRLLYVAGFLQV